MVASGELCCLSDNSGYLGVGALVIKGCCIFYCVDNIYLLNLLPIYIKKHFIALG